MSGPIVYPKAPTGYAATRRVLEQAQQSDAFDASLTVLRSRQEVHKVGLLCNILSTAVVVDGHDIVMFPKRFGDIVAPDGCKDLSYPWQPGLPHSALIGQIAGLIIKSYAQAHFGRRATYIGAISFMAAAIFVPVFAPSLSVPASRVALCGLFMGHISRCLPPTPSRLARSSRQFCGTRSRPM
ncbi:hypothetical protein DB88DRAFT_140944 [Papiliotrema laurentii]|uniref:Uncharacterized protein n=1 Tax=Papiliotrema laurentii TaxID=5418 RepID=A0AAD9FMA9_PAPLA|nr:hypothetical protein DB88DRAFT_140944 [Papiliotrema laurentii]